MGKRYRKSKKTLIIVVIVILIAIGALISMFSSNKLNSKVTVEVGTKTLDVSQFMKNKETPGTFITDLSTINMNVPGTYEIKIQVGEKVYSSILEVKGIAAPVAEKDTEAPKIEGAKDQTIYIGDAVAYKKDITVTDNMDKDVKLVVDSSAVDLKKAGSYKVIYTATDSSGNTATKTVTFTVVEKPKDTANSKDLDALADKVLADITTSNMSEREKAKAIYTWTRSNISYEDHSDKSDWVNAAIQGFTKGTGDCFNYFATAQALLNRAGIKNQEIIKIDGHHYWSLVNIDNAWYHFDATPRKGDNQDFSLFMLTDSQIEAYSKSHGNSHIWDKTKYPATP